MVCLVLEKPHMGDFFDNAGTQCFLAGDRNRAILAFRGTDLVGLDDILTIVRSVNLDTINLDLTKFS